MAQGRPRLHEGQVVRLTALGEKPQPIADHDRVEVPGWMDALAMITPGRSLVIGVALAGGNLKIVVLTLAAGVRTRGRGRAFQGRAR